VAGCENGKVLEPFKRRGISWLCEQLLPSQEGFCSIEIIIIIIILLFYLK
jgi:hypothetical protein